MSSSVTLVSVGGHMAKSDTDLGLECKRYIVNPEMIIQLAS